jgi:hypothetical protein
MTIKGSGQLSMSEINAEFGRGNDLAAYRNVQWWLDDNNTGNFSSSNLGMNQFYGKRAVPVVTSSSYYTSYSGSFQLPYFNYVTVEIWGAGGGGGSQGGYVAQAGGTSAVAIGPYYMEAYGGGPSVHIDNARRTSTAGGGPGYAVGGAYNAQGFSGTPQFPDGGGYSPGDYGGGAGGGAVNGSGGTNWLGRNLGIAPYGGDPGGGGGGSGGTDGRSGNFSSQGGGGGGGYSSSTVYSAQVPWLSTINFTVGGGGYANGGRGGIRFTWG